MLPCPVGRRAPYRSLMGRALAIFSAFILTGCTGVGLFANTVGDLGRDAQLDELEARAERSDRDRAALEARILALQARVTELEKKGEATRAAEAAKRTTPGPALATGKPETPIDEDYP